MPTVTPATVSEQAWWLAQLAAAPATDGLVPMRFEDYPYVARLPLHDDALIQGLVVAAAGTRADGGYSIWLAPGAGAAWEVRFDGSPKDDSNDDLERPSCGYRTACTTSSTGAGAPDEEHFFWSPQGQLTPHFSILHRPSQPDRAPLWVVGWYDDAAGISYRVTLTGPRAIAMGVDRLDSDNAAAARHLAAQMAAFHPYTFMVPASVAAQLPPTTAITRVQRADLTDTGHDALIFLAVDAQVGQLAPDAHLHIATDDGANSLAGQAVFRHEAWLTGYFHVVSIAGRSAVVWTGLAGAHGIWAKVVRWNGNRFEEVFDGASPTILDVQDLDGDGTPEIRDTYTAYCAGNGFPHSVRVYAWTGTDYQPATGRFPTEISTAWRELEDAAQDQRFTGNPQSLACVDREVARLALIREGPTSPTAAGLCAQAAALDPQTDETWCLQQTD